MTHIKFKLCKADIKQFAVFEENDIADKRNVQVNVGFKIRFDIEDSTVFNECTVTFINKEKPIVKVSVELGYLLTPETVRDLTENQIFKLPQKLLMYFATHTYGAVRGVLMAKLENNSVQLLLPLMEINAQAIPPFSMPLKS